MLSKIAKKLTSFFIVKNIINEDERETYDYCFEIYIADIVNGLFLIGIGFGFGKYLQTILFMLLFMIYRSVCGGVHAERHIVCVSSIITIFSIFIGLQFVNLHILSTTGIVLLLIGVVLLLIFAPIDCANKRINSVERKILRKKMFIVLIFSIILFIVLLSFSVTRIYSFTVSYVIFCVSILNVIGFIKNKVRRNNK